MHRVARRRCCSREPSRSPPRLDAEIGYAVGHAIRTPASSTCSTAARGGPDRDRATGRSNPPTIIWVVVDDDEVFIRSVSGADGRWYREASPTRSSPSDADGAGRAVRARGRGRGDRPGTRSARIAATQLARKYAGPRRHRCGRCSSPDILDTTLRVVARLTDRRRRDAPTGAHDRCTSTSSSSSCPTSILPRPRTGSTSFDQVVAEEGESRARFLVYKLLKRARQLQVGLPPLTQTRYINTISPEQEPFFPGDEGLERRIRRLIRWNAVAMVLRANNRFSGIGGHLSTYASAATLYEVGFNHFFRGKDGGGSGDQIFYQGHAAPGIYARAFLEGRLSEEQLDHFRRETGPARA